MIPFITCSYTFGSHSVLEKGWKWKDVTTANNKLYFIEEGELIVEMNNTVTVAKQGDLVLIPAYTLHSCSLTSKNYAKKYWMHFSMKKGSSDFFDDYSLPTVVHISDIKSVSKIFLETIESSSLKEPTKSLKTSKGIYELVLLFLSKCDTLVEKSSESQIEQAVEYVNVNYHENFTLEELAFKFGYTPNYFIKKFKSKTGYTPIKYLTEKKLEEAKRLLEFTNLSVQQVMERVGFLDAAYFSKVFKKALGYSPRNFREIISKKK